MKKITGLNIFVTIVVLAVLGVIVTGLFIVGSPTQERARRLDSQRLSDLQQITYAVDTYYNSEGRLPTDLTELAGARNVYLNSITDPKSREPYAYRTNTDRTYELCADFETVYSNPNANGPDPRLAYPIGGAGLTFWNHGIGRACFTVNVTVQPNPGVPLK